MLPVGNGTLLLGIYNGYCRLLQAGLIKRLPRLLAVQAAACAPILHAFRDGRDTVEPVVPGPTSATGIAIGQPARGAQILAAVRKTGGTVLDVTEQQIEQARNQLARVGFYVEGTSAVTVAALAKLSHPPTSGVLVVLLTGHGLKSHRE